MRNTVAVELLMVKSGEKEKNSVKVICLLVETGSPTRFNSPGIQRMGFKTGLPVTLTVKGSPLPAT